MVVSRVGSTSTHRITGTRSRSDVGYLIIVHTELGAESRQASNSVSVQVYATPDLKRDRGRRVNVYLYLTFCYLHRALLITYETRHLPDELIYHRDLAYSHFQVTRRTTRTLYILFNCDTDSQVTI